jgi:hypothetical protein
MTINRKGGKHKHMKRTRNNGSEDRKNPKHIQFANNAVGEYYAKVIKPYGNRRFEVEVVDTLWKQKKRTHTASMRGSRKVRKFGRVTADKLVMITFDESIGYMNIHLVYQDWETDYINKNCDDGSGGPRIIMGAEINDEAFRFDYSLLDEPNEASSKESKTVSISQLTGIPSDDEDDDIGYYGNSTSSPKDKRSGSGKSEKKKKELDDLIDGI